MNDKGIGSDQLSATLQAKAGLLDSAKGQGYFDAVCHDKDGKEKWRETFANTFTTAGKNDMNDKYLKGSSYTQTVRMGLKAAGTISAADTQSSHAGWNEVGLANAPAYTGNRPSITFGASSAGVSVAPAQSFVFTSAGDVAGVFINNGGSATKDDTTGTLFSVGNLAATRTMANGDTLTITYTWTLS